MAAWMFVLGERVAVEWVLENRVMAFRDHIKAAPLRRGDGFVLYVSRGAFHNPTRDESQILATGTVASPLSDKPIHVMDEEFRQSVRLRFDGRPLPPRAGMPFRPLVPSLAFIRKKDSWHAYVRKALVPIPDADLDLLRSEVRSFGLASARR